MHYVLSGCGTFTDGEQQYELQQGSTFLIEPERLISYASSNSDPWQYRWIAFEGHDAPLLLSACGLLASGPIIGSADRRIGMLYHNVYRALRAGGAAAAARAVGYLQLLLGAYAEAAAEHAGDSERSGERGDSLIRKVTHYLSAQYAVPVSIGQMAEALGYNRAYLSRVFKRDTGMTPVTFLLRLRIDKARQLLRERPELTIEQIAASVGIPDALYFSKQFKRFYNQSPSAYRREVLQMDELVN